MTTLMHVAGWIRPNLFEGILLILLVGLLVDISTAIRAEAQAPPHLSTCLHHRHLVGEAHDLTDAASRSVSQGVVAKKTPNRP